MITAEGEAISGIASRSRDTASDVSIDVSSRGEQWAELGWAGLGWARLAGLGRNLEIRKFNLPSVTHNLVSCLRYLSKICVYQHFIIYSKETRLIENFIVEPERRDF